MMRAVWTDTHCHLDAPEFDADRDAVVARALSAGVSRLVIPAVAVAHFEATQTLAHRHGFAYALGIHPLYVDRADDADLDRLDEALAMVADGRIRDGKTILLLQYAALHLFKAGAAPQN